MKLYAIVSDGVNGPEPLYDSETGAPAVYTDKQSVDNAVNPMNTCTQGGYSYVKFETED